MTKTVKDMPETSFDFIVEWFQKCALNAEAQGKRESSLLWKDGLKHLLYFHSLATVPNPTISAKLEVADKMAEALSFYADKKRTTNDIYMEGGKEAIKALANWRCVNGEKL